MVMCPVTPQSMSSFVPEGLHSLPSAILVYQKSMRWMWANPYFEKEFGDIHRHVLKGIFELSLFTRIGRHEGYVLTNTRKEKIPVELKIVRHGDPRHEVFITMVEDVSVRVSLEKQLTQSSKLAVLGEIAAGIAHELTQPLQVVKRFGEELNHRDLVSSTARMYEIIRSLRTYASQANEDVVDTSVNHIIDDSIRLMKHHLMQKGTDVEVQCAPNLPQVKANPIKFEQVLINILSNARDAIEQAGRKRGKISVSAHSTDHLVEIRIRDNGCGMDESTRRQVFEPFFTTKEIGKGMGLGMSISHDLLKKMNAEISIQSDVGRGSEFTITIPAVKPTTMKSTITRRNP